MSTGLLPASCPPACPTTIAFLTLVRVVDLPRIPAPIPTGVSNCPSRHLRRRAALVRGYAARSTPASEERPHRPVNPREV